MNRNHSTKIFYLAAATVAFLTTTIPAISAGPADETAIRKAWALYTSKNYAASADAFEALIRTSTPSSRLYYYAAAANKSCNRMDRARQLCQYIAANFPQSSEVTFAKQLLAEPAAKTADASDPLKGKNLDEMMKTEEGRKALKEALAKQQSSSSTPTAAVATSVASAQHHGSKETDPSITFDTIAKDSADGITQFVGYPDCSFECSMVSLAMQPRGQKLLASMIRADGQGNYFVRFPGGDGVEHMITPEKMESLRVRDKALWATLLHDALILKFHNHYHGTLEEGLQCMTGKKPQILYPGSTTEGALTSFIADGIKSQDPIVCEANDDFGPLPDLVESGQAYSILGFDAGTGMVSIRNPHGGNSRRFRLQTDPEHKKFEQLNDGVFKMHISMLPKYFSLVCKSDI